MKKDIDLPAIPPSQNREVTAIGKDQLTRKKLQGLLHLITAELKARGTKTPHVFLPYRSRVDDGKLEVFLKRVFPGGIMIDVSKDSETRALLAEFDEFTLTCGLKFLWCRLPNNEIIGWDIYLEFKRKEAEAGYPKDAFLAIMPKCLSSAAHASIVYDFLDLLISLSANSQYNHLNGQKIAKMASIWAFSCAPKSSSAFYDATMVREVSFLEGLEAWKKLSNGLFHLLLSFLRAMLPDTEAETLNLPKTLQSLLIANTYPPPEDINPVKSVITIPCVHVRSTRKSADPYELISKIRHTLRFDKKDSFLSIENYTILKNIFQKESTAEIVSTLTEESRRCLARLTTKSESSNYNIYPGWARLSSGVDPNIPLFSEISISSVTLQDYYIWTWLSSLASDQSASMKALFGRSIVVEAGLRGFQKWMIITETTILSDEYTAMFKNTGPRKKDLPLPPSKIISTGPSPKKEAPLPLTVPNDAPPPPVEKDSLFNEIASAIDNIGLDNKEPVSDYQMYYNSLAQAEHKKDSPAKSLSPPASKHMKDRPRPPPLELQNSNIKHRAKPSSPKKEPAYPEPVDTWNGNNDPPEFQGYKLYAQELSLLPDRSVLEPINDHQRSSENIPARATKTSPVLEVPQRSERRVSPEAVSAPLKVPEINQRQPSQQVRSMVNLPGHFPQEHSAQKLLEPVRQKATEPRHEPYPNTQSDMYNNANLKQVMQHEKSPPRRPQAVESEDFGKHVELTGYKNSVEPERYREPVEVDRHRIPTHQEDLRKPRTVPEVKDSYEDLNEIPYSHIQKDPPYGQKDVRYDDSLYPQQDIPLDQYNDSHQVHLSSPEKKKKKKKRKPKLDGDFAMPNHLPDGPPPEFPPMDYLPEEFLEHAKKNGFELPLDQMENQPRRENKPKKTKKKKSPIQQPPADEYFSQNGNHDHQQYYDGNQQDQKYDQNNQYDLRANGSFDGSNEIPARSQNRGYPEPIDSHNNSFQRSEPGYSEPSMRQHGQNYPLEDQLHRQEYLAHHSDRPQHGQQYLQQYQPQMQPHMQPHMQPQMPPQMPPQQILQRQQMPPQASHQPPPPQFQQPPPQQFQQHVQYSAPMHQNYGSNMQWQQPQGYAPHAQSYAPQPQGYSSAPQGFTPPPQGYGPPMQPMYQPQQGYFPPQQQYGKPRPKPTTSELTMMNMPMAVGIKKKPNKAGMRAALNQGFGI